MESLGLCIFRSFLTLRSVRRDPDRRPLLRFCSPSGVPPEGLVRTSRSRTPLLGFCCRSAHPFQRGLLPLGAPSSRVPFRVQGFSPSARLAPPLALRVYFTPQTPFGFPSRDFPSQRAACTHRPRLCRRAVSPVAALPRSRTWVLRLTNRPSLEDGAGVFGRLHGLAPPESPCHRQVVLGTAVVVPLLGLSSPRSSPPSAMPRISPVLLPRA